MKKKRGRPPTERGAYNPHPNRQIGRVPDAEWDEVRQAAKRSGEKFTQWAMRILLAAARGIRGE